MIDFGKVFLLLCVMCCLGYIYWMHQKKTSESEPKKKTKTTSKNEDKSPEEDNLSFLGSQYELDLTKGDDELLEDIEEN